MRTTLRLDDSLLSDAKRLAAEEKTTLTAIMDSALREWIMRQRARQETRTTVSLPVFHGRGLQPGVDLDDSAALLDLMEPSREDG